MKKLKFVLVALVGALMCLMSSACEAQTLKYTGASVGVVWDGSGLKYCAAQQVLNIDKAGRWKGETLQTWKAQGNSNDAGFGVGIAYNTKLPSGDAMLSVRLGINIELIDKSFADSKWLACLGLGLTYKN